MAAFDIDAILRAQQEEPQRTPSARSSALQELLGSAMSAGLGGAKRAATYGFSLGPRAATETLFDPAAILRSLFHAGAGAYAGPPGVQATVERGSSGFGAIPSKPALTTAVSAPATAEPTSLPMTNEQRSAALEVGRLQAAREALVQAASPEAGGTGISLYGVGRGGDTAAGGFFRATAGMRQIAADNARSMAQQKLLYDLFSKLPGMQKDVAETNLLGVRAAEVERARAAGAGPGEIAAMSAGRSTGEAFTAFPGLTGEYLDVVKTRGPGAGRSALRVKPQPPITEAHIQADMKNKKLTRAQVLEEYQRRGFDTAGFR